MPMSVPDILRHGFDSYRRFVNPMVTLRAELLSEPVKVLSVEDGQLIEPRGPVEDFHGTQSFGHRNPAITEAVRAFLATDSPNWFPSRVNPYAGNLAKKLCDRANQGDRGSAPPYHSVFFGNSGSDGVEAALKLARAVTGRPGLLSQRGAYHGCTMGSCALMQEGMFRDPFGPHLPGVRALPRADIDALASAVRAGDIAAVILEPIQLEGGVHPLPNAFIEAACELTAAHGTLLVADEIQTGLGRTGRFLASGAWPRRPDAVVLGKHLGGGLMPISAMITTQELFDRAYGQHYASAEAHNTTFSGNAAACVAGEAALDLLTDELIARIGGLGARFRSNLEAKLGKHSVFREVRGAGLLVGVALEPSDHPWLSFEHFGVSGLEDQPSIGVLACSRMYRRGYYCFACGHDWRVLRLLPRFNIPVRVLDEFVDALDEELGYLCSLM